MLEQLIYSYHKLRFPLGMDDGTFLEVGKEKGQTIPILRK